MHEEFQGVPAACEWVHSFSFGICLVWEISKKLVIYIACKMSASRLNFNIFKALCKVLEQSIHSKSYDTSLDSLSTLIFLWYGIWAAITFMSFFSYHFQICFVMWRHNSESDVPNLLMHAIAVVVSEKTFTWIPWSLTIDTKLKRMNFISRAFICQFFSVLIYDAPVHIHSQYAPSHALMHQCK